MDTVLFHHWTFCFSWLFCLFVIAVKDLFLGRGIICNRICLSGFAKSCEVNAPQYLSTEWFPLTLWLSLGVQLVWCTECVWRIERGLGEVRILWDFFLVCFSQAVSASNVKKLCCLRRVVVCCMREKGTTMSTDVFCKFGKPNWLMCFLSVGSVFCVSPAAVWYVSWYIDHHTEPHHLVPSLNNLMFWLKCRVC